jgi:hypothetical protein
MSLERVSRSAIAARRRMSCGQCTGLPLRWLGIAALAKWRTAGAPKGSRTPRGGAANEAMAPKFPLPSVVKRTHLYLRKKGAPFLQKGPILLLLVRSKKGPKFQRDPNLAQQRVRRVPFLPHTVCRGDPSRKAKLIS